MSHWRHRATESTEFWISRKQLKLLRKAGRLQLIQNLAPKVARRRQCDIRNNWPIWADKLWGIWCISSWNLSTHFVLSLCVPSPWFSIYHQLFLQKTKFLRNFKGKFIWDKIMNLVCENLGFSHCLFIVRCQKHFQFLL